MKTFLSSVVLILLGCFANAGPFPTAVFHAEYDKDFNALSNKGDIDGKHSQKILWETIAAYLQTGVAGRGALIGTGGDGKQDFHIEYPNRDFFSAKQGSVAFWIKPVDWRPNDKNFHVFFRAEGKDADLIIYKGPWSSELLFLIGPTRQEFDKHIWTIAKGNIGDWITGKWYFIAATWGDRQAALYVNGKQLAAAEYKVVPDNNFTKFGVGGLRPTEWKTPQNISVIDDLMLYDQSLTPAEVRARFASYGIGLVADDNSSAVEPQQVFSMHDPVTKEFVINFVVPCAEPDGTPYRVATIILDKDGKEIFRETVKSDNASYCCKVQPDKLIPGDYQVRLEILRRDDTVRGKTTHQFSVPKIPEVWRNNKIGQNKQVPAPWTKSEWNSEKAEFSCWNRQYIFGNSSLPEQIVSDGNELLAAPVSLCLDGKNLKLAKMKADSQDEESCVLKSEAVAENLKITTTAVAEFDGFIWFDILLTPGSSQKINRLTLEIPFKKEASTLFNSMEKSYFNYAPGDQGVIQDYSMNLYNRERCMFVGSDNYGLEWFCEELSSWYNKQPKQSLQIVTGERIRKISGKLVERICLPSHNSPLC